MPLKVEIYDKDRNTWRTTGTLNPGDPAGSLSDNKEGRRQIYLFECARDDSHSGIYRSLGGIDVERSEMRGVSTLGLSPIAELRKGDYYILSAKTDKSIEERLVRFTHI